MATKSTDKTLQKVAEDEPIFVLRAQDMLAPTIVEYWATLAQKNGSPEDKCNEAIDLAQKMVEWAKEHGSKIPD